MYNYTTTGVCSKKISFDIDNGKVIKVAFLGGCDGNLQGISNLIEGMEINEAIKRLKGIPCGNKSTSCPDQLALALEELKLKNS